jgi:hypothetical protein
MSVPYFLILMMKRKKIYLAVFYGTKQELTKAFTTITNGDYVRYIMTAETLICRFKSNKPLSEILDTLRKYAPDIPFFVFPISTKNWVYNLPMDVENNLLTDNPIITIQNNVINQYFISLLDEIKKQQQAIGLTGIKNSDLLENTIDHLKKRLKESIDNDNFELSAQIRDKIKELDEELRKISNDGKEHTTNN